MLQIPIVVLEKKEIPGAFWRPPFQFSYLPIESKWEATRRHPVYLSSWNPIDSATDKDGGLSYSKEVLDCSRFLLLGAIGISPDLIVSPQTEFSALGDFNPAWKSGVVQPMSFRGLATMLVTFLPKETLAYLGMKFVEAGLEDEISEQGKETIAKKLISIGDIAKSQHEGLDKLSPAPFVSITPGASARQVGREINTLLNQWKEQLNLDEVRERNKKHKDYFAIWDLREGWNSGRYQTGNGKTLIEIAGETNLALTTVHSRFKSAFKLITGHSYRFDTYLELFGWFRYQGLFGPEYNMKWRRLNESHSKPVPETRLGAPLEAITPTKQAETTEDISRYVSQAISEFEGLQKQGLSDDAAAKELGIKSLVDLYRLIELDSLSS